MTGVTWLDFLMRALYERMGWGPEGPPAAEAAAAAAATPSAQLTPLQKQRQLERDPWRSFAEHPRAQLLLQQLRRSGAVDVPEQSGLILPPSPFIDMDIDLLPHELYRVPAKDA